jgi:amidase
VLTLSSLVRPFNLSGHPALSIPVPIAGSLLKAGLQLVGRKGDDERICAWACTWNRYCMTRHPDPPCAA